MTGWVRDQCTALVFPATSFRQSCQPGSLPWIASNDESGISLSDDHAETITKLILERIPLP